MLIPFTFGQMAPASSIKILLHHFTGEGCSRWLWGNCGWQDLPWDGWKQPFQYSALPYYWIRHADICWTPFSITKTSPTTRKVHQITPYGNGIHCRLLSYFCSDPQMLLLPQMCQCFSPTIFQLTENTHARVQAEEMYGPSTMGKAWGPLTMLMEEIELEEIEQESKSCPDETTTDISAGVINCDDWLAVIYDQHWWLAKAVTVDAHNQDVQVEFFHPHMPNTRLHPKPKKDLCFIPAEHILVKLMELSSPGRASRMKEIYHLSAEVMDFIVEKHIHRILPNKLSWLD